LSFIPAKELLTENSPSSSDKDILVGGVFSLEVDNMKFISAERDKSFAIEKILKENQIIHPEEKMLLIRGWRIW